MHRTANWIVMLLTLASAFALYAIKYDTRRLELIVQEKERSLERAENDVAILKAERAHLARPERLEPLARELGLAPLAGRQFLRVDQANPATVAVGISPRASSQGVGETARRPR